MLATTLTCRFHRNLSYSLKVDVDDERRVDGNDQTENGSNSNNENDASPSEISSSKKESIAAWASQVWK